MVSLALSRPPTLWIAVAKGSIATTLVIALTFVRVFDQLIAHPLALNGVSHSFALRPKRSEPGTCTWAVGAGLAPGRN